MQTYLKNGVVEMWNLLSRDGHSENDGTVAGVVAVAENVVAVVAERRDNGVYYRSIYYAADNTRNAPMYYSETYS